MKITVNVTGGYPRAFITPMNGEAWATGTRLRNGLNTPFAPKTDAVGGSAGRLGRIEDRLG